MSRVSTLRTADVLATRTAFARGEPDRAERLRACALRPIRAVRTLREWQDLLLFVAAHPSDPATHAFACMELARVRERTTLVEPHGLLNSGISGADVEASFSLPLVRWMLQRWPGTVALAALDAEAETVREVLRTLLLPVEIEAADLLEGSGDDMMAAVFGEARSTQLTLLVARLDQLVASDAVRDGLFARMGVYVRIAADADPALTTALARRAVPFCHEGALRRQVDVASVMAEPIDAPVRLTTSARRALIDTARTVLAAMQRETDPVTHCSDVVLYDMGRGLRIALFSLDLAHRLPFDSYVGFMAFRNGVPLAYGGAWIFPLRSKIGINVLPSQRGGESAWFFAQLLRLYHHVFGVTRFEAENYQLGHHNPDGLKSGAYWFYYRAGFRPTTGRLQRMAAREADRLAKKRSYSVPLPRLRTLVAEGLELCVLPSQTDTPQLIDTAALTMAVQRHIRMRYGGNRIVAQRQAEQRLYQLLARAGVKTWQGANASALRLWALALDLVPDLESWSRGEQQLLAEVIRAKGHASERQHQALLARHLTLLERWHRQVASANK